MPSYISIYHITKALQFQTGALMSTSIFGECVCLCVCWCIEYRVGWTFFMLAFEGIHVKFADELRIAPIEIIMSVQST